MTSVITLYYRINNDHSKTTFTRAPRTCKKSAKSLQQLSRSTPISRVRVDLSDAQWSPPSGFDMVDLSRIFEKHEKFHASPWEVHASQTFRMFSRVHRHRHWCNRPYKKETDERQKLIHAPITHGGCGSFTAIVLRERVYSVARHETEPNSQANRKCTLHRFCFFWMLLYVFVVLHRTAVF